MADVTEEKKESAVLDAAVAEGGGYDILRRRLSGQGEQLQARVAALNERRLEEFGRSAMEVEGRVRVRTENNCTARDIVLVGDLLVLGYHVFIGLKRETRVEDVFSLYRLERRDEGYEVAAVPTAGSFLDDPGFVLDFNELYAYYKNTRLLMLMERGGKLLAAFQIGERVSDVRVFRWTVSPDGKDIRYIDNRGERDMRLPPSHDFEWTRTGREDQVNGRHPHVNILDTVFVETVGGTLTIKRENNTEDGLGIYGEDVQDKNQSLDDGQIEYARLGNLILLKILPYRETAWRYFVYNILTASVRRIDAIGLACVQLPEDHGIIFPGGCFLQNGEYKVFEQDASGMLFYRAIASPNGEDVLYVFYEPVAGRYALIGYNLIERKLQAPLPGNGFALYGDGRMIVFEDKGGEPSRFHPMQIWRTPFYSDVFASDAAHGDSPLGRIGNAELVRGISDLSHIARSIEAQSVSAALYDMLCKEARRLFDAYFWLEDESFGFGPLLREIIRTGELVLDEYEKVQSIRARSERALREALTRQAELLSGLLPDGWTNIQEFADALARIQSQQGSLIGLRSLRYMDLPRVDAMEAELREREAEVSRATAVFLAGDKALAPFVTLLEDVEATLAAAKSSKDLAGADTALGKLSADLDRLSALMGALPFDDAALQTRIIEGISAVYARANQTRSKLDQSRRNMGAEEAMVRFGAQFSLFAQSMANALSLATDPERCDDELSRLLLRLEELEGQFSGHDNFLPDILQKREEVLEAFAARKQALLDERQRRSQALFSSAERILSTLPRRTAKFLSIDELNTFFVSDPMVRKITDVAAQLHELKDSVRADDLEARLKAARDQALRALRDKTELYEDGGQSVRLGRHRFSVNTQELDLTMLPRGDFLCLQLIGTDYAEELREPRLDALRDCWDLSFESETPKVARAEYLAYSVLDAAKYGRDGFSLEGLLGMLAEPARLEAAVAAFAAPRYRDGYEKGIHDHDARLILEAVLPLNRQADLLRFAPVSRGAAMLFWSLSRTDAAFSVWPEWARSAVHMHRLFGQDSGFEELREEVEAALGAWASAMGMGLTADQSTQAAEFLCLTLARENPEFPCSAAAARLCQGLRDTLEKKHLWAEFGRTRQKLDALPGLAWRLALSWLGGLARTPEYAACLPYVPEAAALILLENGNENEAAGKTAFRLPVRAVPAELRAPVRGLLSAHPRIADGSMDVAIDDFFSRLREHCREIQPRFREYQALRQRIVDRERALLRPEEYRPRPLTTFVRNRLIDEVYLPVVGDNLARQIGASGAGKRSDLMGMLLLISPPGYGKTTLMEYVAFCLGLIFMKINGPALGHAVVSLDPARAPDAAAGQELEKLNLALEMGNNVMLYLDDIQHTNPEFLQKFISLCDATRRMEGVWKGRTKTYDLRGKKFCVVMAGNPYTESGEVFKVPDMLANRADVYNLGEVLGGMEDAFALSYLENCLTSNPVLAPLARRDMRDVYHFVDRAMGKPVSDNDLSCAYGETEIKEIVGVLQRLIRLRDTVLRVNRQYIASASQSDRYRSEPPFKLQGSYRSMNKLAQRVSAVMNDDELEGLLDDFYQREAQLLTGAAEENLLKLAELRGRLTPEQAVRWAEIKKQYLRNKAFGGDQAEVGDRVVAQLSDLVRSVQELKSPES